jgi:hypothetical protein
MTTVTSDENQRIRLGDIGPQEVFQVTRPDADHWLLARLHAPAPPRRMTRPEVKQALREHLLRMKMTWEELRAITREP